MTRLHWFTILFFAVWLLCLALLFVNLPSGRRDALYLAWLFCAVGSLGSVAFDWTLLAAWGAMRAAGPAEDEVPIELDAAQQDELDTDAPRTAILIPAHNETVSAFDRQALADRLTNILRVTPAWCDVHVLFDSPENQRANEQAVCDRVRQSLPPDMVGKFRPWLDELRDKPRKLRSKPGSIWFWLGSQANEYEYMLVLDADSDVSRCSDAPPAQRQVVQRLVHTLRCNPSLAMIQSALLIQPAATWWGWSQEVAARMGENFQGPVMRFVLGREQASYGHGVIFRVSDFQRHCVNTLEYDSHDFLEAADLAAAGKGCIHTANAVTLENAEEPLWSFLAREFRWAKGNAQWPFYLAAKRGLPLGPCVYIAQGILFYLWPLMTTLLVFLSALLVAQGQPVIGSDYPYVMYLLLGLVGAGLILPKLLAVRSGGQTRASLWQVLGVMIVGLLLSPALMVVRGAGFLIGPLRLPNFRRVRTFTYGAETTVKTFGWFAHAAVLGILLALLLSRSALQGGVAWWLLWGHALLLTASPLVALALSLPLPARKRAQYAVAPPTERSRVDNLHRREMFADDGSRVPTEPVL